MCKQQTRLVSVWNRKERKANLANINLLLWIGLHNKMPSDVFSQTNAFPFLRPFYLTFPCKQKTTSREKKSRNGVKLKETKKHKVPILFILLMHFFFPRN